MNLNPKSLTHPSVLAFAKPGNPVLRQLITKHAPDVPVWFGHMDVLKAAAGKLQPPALDVDAVRSALDADSIDELDLVETLGRPVTAMAELVATVSALEDLVAEIHGRIYATLTGAAPRMVADLDERVKKIVGALRAHPITTAGLRDELTAIKTGHGDEWESYSSLRAEYGMVYGALDQLVAKELLGDAALLRLADIELTRLANAEEVCPNFIALRAADPNVAPRSWPADEQHFLTWLIRTKDAVPHVASPEDVGKRHDEVREAVAAYQNK